MVNNTRICLNHIKSSITPGRQSQDVDLTKCVLQVTKSVISPGKQAIRAGYIL